MAGAKSIITTRDKEIANLKAALKESENKYYNIGFNDAENSAKSVMFENRNYGFGEGWMATVTTIGLLEDSPFRNPDQIPYPKPPPPPTQNPTEVEDEDTLSMRELVQAIDSYAEMNDLEITSNPSIVPTSTQPQPKDPSAQPLMNLNPVQPEQLQNLAT